LIVLGSKSDSEYAEITSEILGEFGVSYDMEISSAHRRPEKTRRLSISAEKSGYKIIIAMAGYSAALPGLIASHTLLPVIGVPLPASDLKGIDSALSILQMPGGVPVCAMGIGNTGAKNAALLAVRILSLNDEMIKERLSAYQRKLAKD